MKPVGIHHVSVNVSDPTASLAFYVDVLGGVLRHDRPDFGFGGAWIDFGGAQLHLIEAEVPQDRGQHFAIQVADLDDAVTELRSKGIDIADGMAIGTNRQAFLSDPDGNLVEIHEVGKGSA